MELLSVGEAAARLGVAPSTVRMWGTRYGLIASAQSAGGHRRYTPKDFGRLCRMNDGIIAGSDPASVAAAITGSPKPDRKRRPGGPGGAVLAMPGAGREARGVARAAMRLDEISVEDSVVETLRAQGTLSTWDEVIRPVLIAAGEHWQRTGTGIEVEHLLTQAVTTAFVRHVAALPEFTRDSPVLLAGGPQEEHVLALHAVRGALAERGIPARLLGPRTPIAALAAAARRTRAPGVLIWLSVPDPLAVAGLVHVARAHRRLVLLVGGPGWAGFDVAPAAGSDSLESAADQLERAWQG